MPTETETRFMLKKAAARSGGDRYTALPNGDWDIYVPQKISREGSDSPAPAIVVTIQTIRKLDDIA